MEKQIVLFADEADQAPGKYTRNIGAPVYEPSHAKPHLLHLYDESRTRRLLQEIDAASIREDEKAFLRAAAQRHTVFHYETVADYYAYSTPEMQRLMEASALVIVDFDQAIERGYVKLCDDIRQQYYHEAADDATAA